MRKLEQCQALYAEAGLVARAETKVTAAMADTMWRVTVRVMATSISKV
jgi:hypothetical protein